MKIYELILLILFLPTIVLPVDINGGKAGAFLRNGIDARSESLGRSVAGDTTSVFNIFYNPATGNTFEKTIAASYRFLSLDRKWGYLAYSQKIKGEASISLGLIYSGTDHIREYDNNGNALRDLSFNENLLFFNFTIRPPISKKELKDRIQFGINGKILYSRFPKINELNETESSINFAADIGLLLFLPYDINLGIGIKNLLGEYSWHSSKIWHKGTDKTDEFPVVYDGGLSYKFNFFEQGIHGLNLYTGLEYSNEESLGKGGLEYSFKNGIYEVIIRSGMRGKIFNSGIGFVYNKFILDYSYSFENITPFNPHTLSIRYKI